MVFLVKTKCLALVLQLLFNSRKLKIYQLTLPQNYIFKFKQYDNFEIYYFIEEFLIKMVCPFPFILINIFSEIELLPANIKF